MSEPENSVPRNVHLRRSCIASLLLVLLTLIVATPKPFKGSVVARGYWESSGGANSIECINLGTTPVRALVRVRSNVGASLKEKQITLPGQGSAQLSFKKSSKGKSEPYGSYEVIAAKDKGKPAAAVACITSLAGTGTILPSSQPSTATKSGFFDTAPIEGSAIAIENTLLVVNSSSRALVATIELFDAEDVAATNKSIAVNVKPRGVGRFVLGGDDLKRGTYRVFSNAPGATFDAVLLRRGQQSSMDYAVAASEGSCAAGPLYVSTKEGIQPILTLSNRSEAPKRYTLQAIDESGQTITVDDKIVSPLAAVSVPLADLFGFERTGSLLVSCVGEVEPTRSLILELIHYGSNNEDPTPRWAYAAYPARTNARGPIVFSLRADSSTKHVSEAVFTNASNQLVSTNAILVNKKGKEVASTANDVASYATVLDSLSSKAGASFMGTGRVEPGKNGTGVTVAVISTTRAKDGTIITRQSIPVFTAAKGTKDDALDDLSTIDPGRTAATAATGSISAERIGTTLETRVNLDLPVTTAGYKTANPAVWNYLAPFTTSPDLEPHWIYFTDLPNYTERVGGCDYPLGGTPCTTSTYPSIPVCSNGSCKTGLNVKAGIMSRTFVRYTSSTQALKGNAEVIRPAAVGTTYANIDASATASSKLSANPALWSNKDEGMHSFSITDLAGYTEYMAFCEYPIGGTRCTPTDYSGMSCANGSCSRPGHIPAGRVLSAVAKYIKPNDAACVYLNAPTNVQPGEKFTAEVRMQNIGTNTWTTDANPHRLGSIGDSTRWGPYRVALPNNVTPNMFVNFTVNATAPTTLGTYAFDWGMLEEWVEWFGTPCRKQITVTPFDYSITSNGDKRGDIATYPNTKKTTVLDLWLAKAPSLPVTLTIDPLPAGISASLSTTQCQPNCSPVLSVTTAASVVPGIYPLTVRGTPFNRTLTLNVVVGQPPLSTDRLIPNDRVVAAWYQEIPIRKTPGDAGMLVKNESHTAMLGGIVDSSRFVANGRDWWRVKFDSGITGWVPGEALASDREISSAVSRRSSPSTLPSYKGEMDLISGISVTDGVLALRCAAGLSPCDPNQSQMDSRSLDLIRKIADVDCDGTPSVTDAVNILRKAAGLTVTFCQFSDFNYWLSAGGGFSNGNVLRPVAGGDWVTGFLNVLTTSTQSSAIEFSANGVPTGIEVYMVPKRCEPAEGGCAPLGVSVKAPATTPPGDYPFTVKGSLLNQEFRVVAKVSAKPNIAPMDIDGDGKSDMVTWSRGVWSILGKPSVIFGVTSDIPVPADYNGDGKTELAVWRQSDPAAGGYGRFYVLDGPTVNYGGPGDWPVAGDFTGDGKADFAVWRQSEKRLYVRDANGPGSTHDWQAPEPSDIPLTGDFNGDRRTDIAFYRPKDAKWFIRYINGTGPTETTVQFGIAITDIPVPADYNGDGKTDIAVARIERPTSGHPYEHLKWYFHNVPDAPNGITTINGKYLPAPGDYNGDGKAEPAAWKDPYWGLASEEEGYWVVNSDGKEQVVRGGRRSSLPLHTTNRYLSRYGGGEINMVCDAATGFDRTRICFPLPGQPGIEILPPSPPPPNRNLGSVHPMQRVGTPGFLGTGTPYQPKRIRVKLWALPDAIRGKSWRVTVRDPDTDEVLFRTEARAASPTAVPETEITFNPAPGRYSLTFGLLNSAGEWVYLDSYGDVRSDYCLNCFDHPIDRFDPWADYIDDIQVDTFVDVSIVGIPDGGSFSYESENFNIDDIRLKQLRLVERHDSFGTTEGSPQERNRPGNISALTTSTTFVPRFQWKWPTCTVPALSITPSLYQPSTLNMNMDFRPEIRAAQTQWASTGSRAQIQPLRELAEDFPPLKNYGFNTINLVPHTFLFFNAWNQLTSFQKMNAAGQVRFLTIVGPASGSGNPNNPYGMRGILSADILLSDILLSATHATNEQERRNMIYNVFLHEMGHYLGVSHGSDRNIVMTVVGLQFLKAENAGGRIPLTSQDVQPLADGFTNCSF